MTKQLILCTILAACGSSGGSGGGVDAPGASSITLSGTALSQGQNGSAPIASAAVAAYKNGDDATPVAMTTSDGQGKYSMTIDVSSFDGYIKLTASGYTDTYAYPAAAVTHDVSVDTSMIASNLFGLLIPFAGGDTSKGVIIATTLDSTGAPVAGATVSSSPASGVYKYMDANGQPTSTSGTAADGIAFFLTVPSGSVSVTANKSGSTFHSHSLTARVNALTLTQITE